MRAMSPPLVQAANGLCAARPASLNGAARDNVSNTRLPWGRSDRARSRIPQSEDRALCKERGKHQNQREPTPGSLRVPGLGVRWSLCRCLSASPRLFLCQLRRVANQSGAPCHRPDDLAAFLPAAASMSSGSIRNVEDQGLARANDSQDTLLLAHYVMKDFGVGLVSCLFPVDPRMLGQAS